MDDDDHHDDGVVGEVPRQVEELANATVPNNLRHIRACKRCGILKTIEQFVVDGCENCPFLDMQDNVEMYTTAFFEGTACIMDPRDSWAAKWIRVDNFMPGVYAIVVTGQFDRDTEEDLENRGIRWRCRPPQK